ncbi:pre-RNA processing PIH1/Nop17-domain-containing protein [Paraphysoderma sedebokerense]|nr:pre-RNA processing PIH1/Nop17-domain-containing protein [Paraphysoderma sedebokerense]
MGLSCGSSFQQLTFDKSYLKACITIIFMTKEARKNKDPSILEQLSNIPLPDDVRNNLSQTEWDQMMNNVFSDLMKDDQVKDNIKELQNAAIPSHTIQPQSGFVLKTHLNKSTQSYPAGLKVFINMTHSPEIPAPPLCTDEEIKRAIEAADTSYKVPLSLAELRDGEDKGGRPCVVFSACINSDPFFKSENDFDFKLFIIELAMELIEERFKMELSREFTLPKLKHKGPVMPHVIRRPKRAAITDLSRDKVKDKSSATNPKSLIMTSEAEPKIIPLSSQKEKIPNYRVTKSDDGTKLLIDIELPELVG